MSPLLSALQRRIAFPIPAADVRAGIPLVNGTLGALLCGEGRFMRITFNRSDYGGGAAETGNAELLPMGRVDLELPHDWTTAAGGLHPLTGEAELELDGHRTQGKLRAAVLRDAPVLCLRITGLDGASVQVRNRPPDAPDVLERFHALGMPRAQTFDLDEFGGWMQERPGAPAVCVGWLRHDLATGFVFYATAAYGDTPPEARKAALGVLGEVRTEGYTSATLRSFGGWRRWWGEMAAAQPSASAQEIVRCLEMYRQGGRELRTIRVPRTEAADTALRAGEEMDTPVDLSTTADGDLAVSLAGREAARVPLRPAWLDGGAIRGHKPPTKAYRP
jgi:hypothetical protein